jgi:hypothetical protein
VDAVAIAFVVVATLVEITGTDQQKIWVNPQQVISVREPRGIETGHWPRGTRCLLLTMDSRLIVSSESCNDVRRKLQQEGAQ